MFSVFSCRHIPLIYFAHIFPLTVVIVCFLVKNANSVLAAEDVALSCGVAVLPNSLKEVLSVAVALSRPLLEHLHCLVVTLGANGVLVCGEHDAGSVNMQPRKQKRVRTVYNKTHTEDEYCVSDCEDIFYCTCVCREDSFVLYTTQRWLWLQKRQWMSQGRETGAKNLLQLLFLSYSYFNFLFFLSFSSSHLSFPMTSIVSLSLSFFLSHTK